MNRRGQRPVLITDAAQSQDHQLRSREVRYVIMMSIRAACLILGTILVTADVPLLWLWLPLCGIGMVVVPWLAVLIANDRPPRRRANLLGRLRRDETPPAALPAAHPPRTIDVDP